MTAIPHTSSHLYTVAEYMQLGEDENGYTELVEGRLIVSPSPVPDHNFAGFELAVQLKPQLPDELELIQDMDVDLEFAPADQPGSVRRPDLIVVDRKARKRVRHEGGLIRASDVAVIVEIVSPGSKRTDYKTKHLEYADAGIPHYWILDTTEPVSLVECHLAGEFGYQDREAVTGEFTTDVPFPVTLRLDQLL
jgi:Uma2 family endonuclease